MSTVVPTHVWVEKFFIEYEKSANISQSAIRAGVTRDAIFKRQSRSRKFAARLDAAKQAALDKIEAVLIDEAQNGDVRTGQWILARQRPWEWSDPVQRAEIAASVEMEAPVQVVLTFSDGTPCPPLRLPFGEKKSQ